MAKKSDYSLFINFFFNSLKKGLFIFRPLLFTILSLCFGSLFTIHYKKGPLFFIPHPDPQSYVTTTSPKPLRCLHNAEEMLGANIAVQYNNRLQGRTVMVLPASCPNSMVVSMGNCRHKVKVLDIPSSWGMVTNDWCIKTKEIMCTSHL